MYFAHGGEIHESSTDAAQHALELNPVIGTMFAIGFVALITLIVFKVTKSSTAATFSLLAQLLAVGILTYSALPLLSGIFIVVGFLLSMLLAFGGLSSDN